MGHCIHPVTSYRQTNIRCISNGYRSCLHYQSPDASFAGSYICCIHCQAAFAYQPGMKAHPTTPCFSGLFVKMVARTVLFLGVQIVPVDIVVWVGSPFSDQIYSPSGVGPP